MIGKEAGQVRADNELRMPMVWCPRGFVRMEQIEYGKDGQIIDIKRVGAFVTQGYWLGKYEVTQAEWKQLMRTAPWKGQDNTKEGDDYPATWVDWDDTTEFCRRLTERERQAGRLPDGWKFDLPTEAQWERACRAHTETTYSFGDDASRLGEYAWFLDNAMSIGEQYAHRVGQKRSNSWGLHDMLGNVSEWCRDNYTTNLPGGRDPCVIEIADPESRRVDRGGRWYTNAACCAAGLRAGTPPKMRIYAVGFRVALSPLDVVK